MRYFLLTLLVAAACGKPPADFVVKADSPVLNSPTLLLLAGDAFPGLETPALKTLVKDCVQTARALEGERAKDPTQRLENLASNVLSHFTQDPDVWTQLLTRSRVCGNEEYEKTDRRSDGWIFTDSYFFCELIRATSQTLLETEGLKEAKAKSRAELNLKTDAERSPADQEKKYKELLARRYTEKKNAAGNP